MALQLRSKGRIFSNPSLINLFSTTSSPSDPSDPNDESNSSSSSSSSSSQSPMSSYFSDVKASLKHTQRHSPPEPRRPAYSNNPSLSKPSMVEYHEEIRKNLSEFRRVTSVPPPTTRSDNSTPSSPPGSSQHISFQELYKKNVMGMQQSAEKSGDGRLSFDPIMESMKKHLRSSASGNEKKVLDPMALSAFKNTLKLKPTDVSSSYSSSSPGRVVGGTNPSPLSFLREDWRGEKKDKDSSNAMRTDFVKMYSYGELGEKLKVLRPEAKGNDWFSFQELNDRLMKLREREEKEMESKGGGSFADLRDSLIKLQQSGNEQPKCKYKENCVCVCFFLFFSSLLIVYYYIYYIPFHCFVVRTKMDNQIFKVFCFFLNIQLFSCSDSYQ